METPSRRALLASVPASALAGCFSSESEAGESKLGVVTVSNLHDQPHTIYLKIKWEGELVHDRSYDLPADDPESRIMESTMAEPTWPKGAGDFVLSARTEGRNWHELTPEEHDYPDCISPNVMVDSWGLFGIEFLRKSKYCTNRDQYPLNGSPESEPTANDSADNTSGTDD